MSRELLGPGDFFSPEEMDDGICEDCGGAWDCLEECECPECLPFSCDFCDLRMSETVVCVIDDETYCPECFKEKDTLRSI